MPIFPLPEGSLYELIIDAYESWRGGSFARSQIRHFDFLYDFNVDLNERPDVWRDIEAGYRDALLRIGAHKNIFRSSCFKRAYQKGWSRCGSADAEQGRYRGHVCGVPGYFYGWCHTIGEFRKLGWRNERMEKEYSLIQGQEKKGWDLQEYILLRSASMDAEWK